MAFCFSPDLIGRGGDRIEPYKPMEQSAAHAQEKIAKLELEVERLRTALIVIYDISQDRITPAWQRMENIAVTAKHAVNRTAE